MIYQANDLQRIGATVGSNWGTVVAAMLRNPGNLYSFAPFARYAASTLEVLAHASAPRGKPEFGIGSAMVAGETLDVVEEVVVSKPFGDLVRFRRAESAATTVQPRLLIVAPMSGHHATLLRGTVERLLPSADVYITDWRDARLVPLSAGRFDLDDYIDYLIEFLDAIGTGAHMLAVCQPSAPALAATALMSAQRRPTRPLSLTLMGGTIDTRSSPTAVNTVATGRPFAWFEQNVVMTVPPGYPGAGRRVYPGFLQLTGFMAMNLGNHLVAHWNLFNYLVEGDGESASATMRFYDEYRSVCDMTAEFYLQTIDVVFQRHLLARGEMTHRGQPVDLDAIDDVPILAIEGERDDISGIGQTRAALDLTSSLPAIYKKYVLASGVGHYGVFNGSAWRDVIAPQVEDWMVRHKAGSVRAEQ